MLMRCLALLAIIASFGLGKSFLKYLHIFLIFKCQLLVIQYHFLFQRLLNFSLIFFSDPCDGFRCYQGHYVPTLNYNYSVPVICSQVVIQCMVVERPLFVEGKIIFLSSVPPFWVKKFLDPFCFACTLGLLPCLCLTSPLS